MIQEEAKQYKLIPRYEKLKEWLKQLVMVVYFIMPALILLPWRNLADSSDFFQYYSVAKLMQAGQYSRIYDSGIIEFLEKSLVPNSSHGYFPFINTPIFAWILYPLIWLKFKWALYVWTISLEILILTSSVWLCDLLEICERKKLYVITLIGALGPCTVSVWLGQMGPIFLLGLVGLLVGLKRKHPLLAAISQSLFWFKPQLILPVFFFELAAGYRNVTIVSFLIALVGMLISCILGGFSIIPKYIQLLREMQIEQAVEAIDPTLLGQLLRLSCNFNIANKIAIAAWLATFGLAFYIGKHLKNSPLRFTALFSVIIPMGLCFTLHLRSYDLILLIPGVLMLAKLQVEGWLKYLKFILVGGITAILILPAWVLIHYKYIAKGGMFDFFFLATLILTIGSSIILVSLFRKQADEERVCNQI